MYFGKCAVCTLYLSYHFLIKLWIFTVGDSLPKLELVQKRAIRFFLGNSRYHAHTTLLKIISSLFFLELFIKLMS